MTAAQELRRLLAMPGAVGEITMRHKWGGFRPERFRFEVHTHLGGDGTYACIERPTNTASNANYLYIDPERTRVRLWNLVAHVQVEAFVKYSDITIAWAMYPGQQRAAA